MIISYTHELPMGHRLQNHEGKCKYLHGHNYLITVEVTGIPHAKTGMVLDFHDLKEHVRKYFKQWDHAFALEIGDPCKEIIEPFARIQYLPFPPTAEGLAEVWCNGLQRGASYTINLRVKETRDCEVVL